MYLELTEAKEGKCNQIIMLIEKNYNTKTVQ